jgi:hypothetical protein
VEGGISAAITWIIPTNPRTTGMTSILTATEKTTIMMMLKNNNAPGKTISLAILDLPLKAKVEVIL